MNELDRLAVQNIYGESKNLSKIFMNSSIKEKIDLLRRSNEGCL